VISIKEFSSEFLFFVTETWLRDFPRMKEIKPTVMHADAEKITKYVFMIGLGLVRS